MIPYPIRIVFLSLSLFICHPSAAQTASDSSKKMIVHILHGSKPAKGQKGEYKMLGAMYGGHVVIELDTFVYGLNFTSGHVRPFPKKKKCCGIFQKQGLKSWTRGTSRCKVTRIEIPLTEEQYQKTRNTFERYHRKAPYDYAFFGMRCAASCYHSLGVVGVIKPCSKTKSMRKAFYPAPLRRKLERLAGKRKYKVTVQQGSKTRKWEGD
jgi:hypothetical protein